MGSLLDQMLKAGLVNEKDAKKNRHALRQEDKQTPKANKEEAAQARKAQVEAERLAQKARDQEANRAKQAELDAKVRQAGQAAKMSHQVATLFQEGRILGWDGPRKYYFTEGRKVELLMVNDDVARKLEQGLASICRGDDPVAPYVLLTSGSTKQLRELAPERVITFWGP